MKTVKRKVVAFILVFSLIFVNPMMIFAANNISVAPPNEREVINAIQNSLSFVYSSKELIRFSESQFNNLSIGGAIPVYEYTNNEFVQLDFWYYPIFSGDQLLGLSIVREIQGVVTAQFKTSFIKNLSEIRGKGELAFVFDADSLFLFSEQGFSDIYNFSSEIGEVKSRGKLSTDIISAKPISAIETVRTLSTFSPITGISIDKSMRASSTYAAITDLIRIPQVYDQICWAASIATIGNTIYRTATHNAQSIAQSYYGPADFNHWLEPHAAIPLLNAIYNLNYDLLHRQEISASIIHSSISAHHPVFINFEGYGTPTGILPAHACVVYLINLSTGVFGYMDPSDANNTLNFGVFSGTSFSFVDDSGNDRYANYFGVD